VAEDKNNEEEKFDFTPEGEGYISLDEARVLAVRTAVETPGSYGRDFRRVTMVFDVVESTETDDHYTVILSVRPQGNFDGTPGQEQFVIGKDGTIAVRQVLSSIIRKGGGFPILPVAIGLVVVGVIAAVGAVVVLMSSGGDSVPVAAVAPTETPTPAPAVIPADTPEPTAPTETPAPAPTFTPMPTYTLYPTYTLPPPPRPTPTARMIVATPDSPTPTLARRTQTARSTAAPTYTPYPTPTAMPTYTPYPTPTLVPTVPGYFTVGSTKDEVLVAQGTPDGFSDTTWSYNVSKVYFQNGLVTGWLNTGVDELKARMTP
jgi:hypothetical protein